MNIFFFFLELGKVNNKNIERILINNEKDLVCPVVQFWIKKYFNI